MRPFSSEKFAAVRPASTALRFRLASVASTGFNTVISAPLATAPLRDRRRFDIFCSCSIKVSSSPRARKASSGVLNFCFKASRRRGTIIDPHTHVSQQSFPKRLNEVQHLLIYRDLQSFLCLLP